MNTVNSALSSFDCSNFNHLMSFHPFCEYFSDRTQRVFMFADILRKNSTHFFKDLEKGQPPVISFKYEIVMDGRTFDKPVNYALTRIIERRSDQKRREIAEEEKRKKNINSGMMSSVREQKRPIIIIDPRSGAGPGIAGSKKNSEIGIALEGGHPVYYIIFFPKPEKGQTLEDVKNAEICFIEEVKRRHPDAPRPSVIGNSQAGWALAMLNAEEPDLAGPMILNGSPLSYWAGRQGKHVMRYRTGIMGGSWLVSFLCDLGNGEFDGAHLASGYEAVDPANSFFRKPYKLFANIDKEQTNYLRFERWWSSYYMMTEEEVHFMVTKLFIENSLEKGEAGFQDGKKIDLKDLKDPVVLFSSGADNVTPPQQALNWILKVWGSVDEIKKQGKVIVYLLHDNIRHMGIFVSDEIAKKEHKGIIGSVDKVGYLSPGLYEMIIEKGDPRYTDNEYDIKFEARTFEDIEALDDTDLDELDFYPVVAVSNWNDHFYRQVIRPMVKTLVNKWNAPAIKQSHPQRLYRYAFSEMNPFMYFVKEGAKYSKDNRVKASRENPYVMMEEKIAEFTGEALDFQRELRDAFQEYLFRQVYGNPFIKALFPPDETWKKSHDDKPEPLDRFKKFEGGFPEGLIRMLVAVAGIDDVFHDSEISAIMDISQSHPKLQSFKAKQIKEIIVEQSGILHTDFKGAVESLPTLIKNKKDRLDAINLTRKIAGSDNVVSKEEDQLIIEFMRVLELKD